MKRREQLRRDLWDFAKADPLVEFCTILHSDRAESSVKAQDIIDECTMLVADCQDPNSVAAVRERRLRELVAVMMKLHELGLRE